MSTAYAIAWMDPTTLQIVRVNICSEGAMTLTRADDNCPLEMFSQNGPSFQQAQNAVYNEIMEAWMFKWARSLLQKEGYPYEPL